VVLRRFRGNYRGRVERDFALAERTAVDGLQRYDTQRILQLLTNAAGPYHQDRQRASQRDRGRSGLELSNGAMRRTGVAQATRWLGEEIKEVATPIALALYEAGRRGQR
jgi:hypothetical protein